MLQVKSGQKLLSRESLGCNSSRIGGNLENQHKLKAFPIGKVSNKGYGHGTELSLSSHGVWAGTANLLLIKINKGGKSSAVV